MALMVRARDLATPLDWLSYGDKLWSRVKEGESLGEIRFTLPQRQDQNAREVVQEVSSVLELIAILSPVKTSLCFFNGEWTAAGTQALYHPDVVHHLIGHHKNINLAVSCKPAVRSVA